MDMLHDWPDFAVSQTDRQLLDAPRPPTRVRGAGSDVAADAKGRTRELRRALIVAETAHETRRFVLDLIKQPGIHELALLRERMEHLFPDLMRILERSPDGTLWEVVRVPVDPAHAEGKEKRVYGTYRGIWFIHGLPGLRAAQQRLDQHIAEALDPLHGEVTSSLSDAALRDAVHRYETALHAVQALLRKLEDALDFLAPDNLRLLVDYANHLVRLRDAGAFSLEGSVMTRARAEGSPVHLDLALPATPPPAGPFERVLARIKAGA